MMTFKEQNISYYTLVISNFLAALGGGTILSKGIDALHVSYLKGGSLFAFFIGAILGLFFLQLIPKKISKSIAPWFSMLCAVTSCLLLIVFWKYSIEEQLFSDAALLFFALLCLRFSFWFYSRVLRVSVAASQHQTVALLELGYYGGIIIGMIICGFFDLRLGMITALSIDIAFQFFAGVLDLTVHHRISTYAQNLTTNENNQASETILNTSATSRSVDIIWTWKLALSVIAAIIGTQCIVFVLTHSFASSFVSYIIAIYYGGASVSAIICKKTQIKLHWEKIRNSYGRAQLAFLINKKERNVSLVVAVVLCVLCVEMLIVMTNYISSSQNLVALPTSNLFSIIFLCFAFSAGFFSEILSVTILDRIGKEETYSTNKNMIIRTYSLMAIILAVCFFIMGFLINILFYFTLILLVCFSFVILNLHKRKIINTVKSKCPSGEAA